MADLGIHHSLLSRPVLAWKVWKSGRTGCMVSFFSSPHPRQSSQGFGFEHLRQALTGYDWLTLAATTALSI
jgi:hypothetical protein